MSHMTQIMAQSITDTLVMVEPTHFAFNEETAISNVFQKRFDIADCHRHAFNEFESMRSLLQQHHIRIIVLESPQKCTPDAIFPNNWFSTHVIHAVPHIFIYPMYSANRKAEVQCDQLLKSLKQALKVEYRIQDWRAINHAYVLEGTGALVFDRQQSKAYLSHSIRTNQALAKQVVQTLGYKLIDFHSVDGDGVPIYHTNVMMSIGDTLAFCCLDVIKELKTRELLVDSLKYFGREVIYLTEQQLIQMSANVLQVKSTTGQRYLLLSRSADQALTHSQKIKIDRYAHRLIFDIPTIEQVGGGSVRCMLAEIFY